jgi:hypothetical protein
MTEHGPRCTEQIIFFPTIRQAIQIRESIDMVLSRLRKMKADNIPLDDCLITTDDKVSDYDLLVEDTKADELKQARETSAKMAEAVAELVAFTEQLNDGSISGGGANDKLWGHVETLRRIVRKLP